MDLLASNSERLLEKSMGFLWTKQAAILDNIANAETPNYKAKLVTFEESIRARIEATARGAHTTTKRKVGQYRQEIEQADVTVTEPGDITRTDDNGVSVTDQMVELVRNAYQTQYVMQCISGNLNLIKTAVRGQ